MGDKYDTTDIDVNTVGEVYPDGVCQGERDSERQSFWYGDNEHRHADDEVLDKLMQIPPVPGFVLDGEFLD